MGILRCNGGRGLKVAYFNHLNNQSTSFFVGIGSGRQYSIWMYIWKIIASIATENSIQITENRDKRNEIHQPMMNRVKVFPDWRYICTGIEENNSTY